MTTNATTGATQPMLEAPVAAVAAGAAEGVAPTAGGVPAAAAWDVNVNWPETGCPSRPR